VRDDLRGLVEHGHWLLQEGDRRVAAAALRANPAPSSLVLVEPSDLTWYIEHFGNGRQYKTNFLIPGGGWCQFSVTDPPIHERLVPLADGSHARGVVGIADDSDLFLLVSLSEPFEKTDDCYKLVAGTLEVPAA
jgi:Dual OB-containing domain